MLKPLVTYQPAANYPEALARAAKMWGIEASYFDIRGRRHQTSIEGQRAVLKSLGVAVETMEEAEDAIHERLLAEWSALAAPVVVETLTDAEAGLPVQVPVERLGAKLRITYRWEDGTRGEEECDVEALRTIEAAELRGRVFLRKRVPFPAAARLGYHEVDVTLSGAGGDDVHAALRLILAPERAYLPPALADGGRTAGVGVSLYGIRSERNWGCGDLTDLKAFIDWAVEDVGAGFIALNPLHAIHNRQPFNTSPYLPNCIFYRNPIYLDVERVAGFAESRRAAVALKSAETRAELEALRRSEFVEYERVWAIKKRFLRLAFLEFVKDMRRGAPETEPFREFMAAEGERLDRYAVYCALDEWIHARSSQAWTWHDWPEAYRDPDSPEVARFARRHRLRIAFYKFLQWQMNLQLSAVQRHALSRGMPIGLYHDLALATDRCGSDLWAYRPFYVAGCRVGAPPDDFSPDGQDWSFPPPNSEHHRRTGYELFADSIRKNARAGGALRMDHVMRFFRLFWIPDGWKATEGVYVRDYQEDLLRILALESVRNRVVLIGEDLGTVEPEVREELERFGVLSYRLLYFERADGGRFRLPNEYPKQALVSVATHDLATLAGFWKGMDIEARRKAGLLTEERAYKAQLAERARDKQRLLETLIELSLLPDWFPRQATALPELTGELHNAVVGFLVSTPSMLMALNQEDLFKQAEQQNLPGSTWQYPNWRRKMPFRLEELRANRLSRDCASMLRNWLEKTGRVKRRRE
jgi:4-alpha-glucanotransferase